MGYWEQFLQALLLRLPSAPPRGFRATFLDLISSLSSSLEQATTCFKIAIASIALVNPEPYECQIKCVHRGR